MKGISDFLVLFIIIIFGLTWLYPTEDDSFNEHKGFIIADKDSQICGHFITIINNDSINTFKVSSKTYYKYFIKDTIK